MNKQMSSVAAAAGSLLLTLTASPIASMAQPWSPQPPASDSKTDCSKQSSGQKSKDCDKIGDERMSTRNKEEMKSSSSKTSESNSNKSSGLSGSFGKMKKSAESQKAKDESASRDKSAGTADKAKATESDKVSAESTRDSNSPKSADKERADKPDSKPDSGSTPK